MNIGCEWRNGVQVFFDRDTTEILDVMATTKILDHFVAKALDTTNKYNAQLTNSGTAAITTGVGGFLLLTTGGTNTNDVQLATPLIFDAAKGCVMEARLTLGNIADVNIVLGFTDSVAESAGTLAASLSTTTYTTTATNCALFLFDSGATSGVWHAIAVKADTDATAINSTTAPVGSTYNLFRVEINESGDCTFWLDGVHIGTSLAAITTTTPLCAYIGIQTRTSGTKTATVDKLYVYQK
jgi:hypothetical protein